ncbi:hypothetical protein Tco_0838351 [Tanacetum coccineum]|uniref:Uncharacterized protein n=1 Tax=Tanacetum coccineum TaxID=301880 RepID=A0ABQ5APB2_9ASTR
MWVKVLDKYSVLTDHLIRRIHQLDTVYLTFYSGDHRLSNAQEKGYDNITLCDDGESSDDDYDKSNLINHHDISPFLDPYQAAKNEGDNKGFIGIRTLEMRLLGPTVKKFPNLLDIFLKRKKGGQCTETICTEPEIQEQNVKRKDRTVTNVLTGRTNVMPTTKGVGLRVADFHTGNHPEDGFTPLGTIQRLLVAIGRRSYLGFEGEAFEPERRELNEFLSFYPIPSEYDVILPKSTETIFDAPPGYVGFVRVFDDPILFLAGLKPSWEFGQQRPTIIVGENEMAFRNFIYTEDDDDLVFLPKDPSPGFGTGSPSASVNTELPKDVGEPEVQPAEVTVDSGESPKSGVFVVHPGSVAARIKERKCKTIGGSSRPPVIRKLASGSSSSRAVRAKNSASKDDDPIVSISDDDEGKFLVIKKMRGEADVINSRERSHEEECKELRVKCEAAMADFDQNSTVRVLREKISSLTTDVKEHKGNLDKMMIESQKWSGYQVTLSTLESKVDSLEAEKARLEAVEASLHREVEELKKDRKDVVSKVVPYAALELVHSDELGRLVGMLVSSTITYGRCRAYEQVTTMKDPFDLSKAKGYCSSYKKEHAHDSNDFATATFPWLDEFVADAAASIESLLSKKPPALQKPAPSRTQMHVPSSQKATSSSAPSLNPMSPPADLVKPSPPPFE